MTQPFDKLVDTATAYQMACDENYKRVRSLADEVCEGLQGWLGASDGVCVHLVPPAGAFKPMAHGDKAFSQPPRGFRQLEPIAFGLAVRVSRGTDWIRLAIICGKSGDKLSVGIVNGKAYRFSLPIKNEDPAPFYQHIYDHILSEFQDRLENYTDGAYGGRAIGFEFFEDETPANPATV